ncbi:MAG TPA: extracellular solute-binding protein [Candidatus Avipropionibacterium avicola]|uniref:Extracellular solute-binding protein n=1 Tax=Candidatus Avipropionibacterium avicola TaxID=2840701 RepID=A0A9D1KMF5_9ACTN|nr:extracellular solute-binding protein [Candidatus Avipropionibacterium avicola]
MEATVAKNPARRTLQLLIAAVVLAVITACGGGSDPTQDRINDPDPNINPTGMPIVKDKITISMMTPRYAGTAEDWNTVASMKRMEELSNVHVDWGLIPWESGSEKVNLALASGDYPEVLHRANLSAVDVARYGDQGTFLALNDLIDNYMPNLKAVMDENPEIRRGMTFPDGNIYSLPTIYDADFDSLMMQQKLWVRQDWLDKFGMDVPETIDEFEAYLKAVVTQDPNGNGKADEIGASSVGAGDALFYMFRGTFGIGNRGVAAGNLDADEQDQLRFWPASDGYRDFLEWMSHLYAEGLIQEDLFSNDDTKFRTRGAEGVFGAVAAQTPENYFGKEGENYVALPPLKRNASDPVPSWNAVGTPLTSIGQFVITDASEHPIETARWMDYFYSDEGARLFFMGIEGESYEEKADGSFEFLPVITDNPDGLSEADARRPYVTYAGGRYPGLLKEEYFKGAEASEQARQGTTKVAPHRIDEVWPKFTYSPEEAPELSALEVDITKLVTETRDKVIAGQMSVQDWDTYLSQLDRAGLERYLEIQRAALDRYRS